MQIYNHLTMTVSSSNMILIVLLTLFTTGQMNLFDRDLDIDDICGNDCVESLRIDGCCPDSMCRSADIGLNLISPSSTSYWVIQSCPNAATDDIRALCEESSSDVTSDLTTLIPVSSESTTFFNKYCAACYNISNYKSWFMNISCLVYVDFQNFANQKDILNKAVSLPYCSVAIQPSEAVQAETCYSFLGSRLDVGGGEFLGEFSQGHPDIVSSFIGGRRGQKSRKLKKKVPLSIILNFNDAADVADDVTEDAFDNNTCLSEQWSHNLTNTCFDVHCFPGKQLIEDRCVSIIKDGRGLMYRFPLTLRSVSMVERYNCDLEESVKDVMLTIAEQLKTESFECAMTSRFLEDGNQGIGIQETQKATYLEILFIYKLIITQTFSRDQFENTALEILDKTWNMTCGESLVELFTVGQNERISSKHSNLELPFPPQTHNAFQLEYMSYFDDNDSFVTITPIIVCRFLIFEHSQYELDMSIVTIQGEEGPLKLSKGEYDITDDGDLRVCVDVLSSRYDSLFLQLQTNRSDAYNIHHEIQMYLSYVCITLSLLGLLITFIVYMVIPSLRSLPAKNNICLVFNLFWAQLLLQFGIKLTENRPLCQTLGVLIHFFWLSALLSMNVCSYHMYSVFSCHKMAVMPKHSSTKRLIKYIAYSYTLSALIVTSTIISQYIITAGRSIGYGDRYCYLSSAILIGFAFALPLGIILLLNGIMFVLAVRSIARTSRIQSEVVNKGRQNLHVYIKLSTLTGLFWFVGILAEFSQWNAFTYMSIILNGSQGIFIFVACICNKRVLHLTGCFKKPSYKSNSSDKIKTMHTKSTSITDTK